MKISSLLAAVIFALFILGLAWVFTVEGAAPTSQYDDHVQDQRGNALSGYFVGAKNVNDTTVWAAVDTADGVSGYSLTLPSGTFRMYVAKNGIGDTDTTYEKTIIHNMPLDSTIYLGIDSGDTTRIRTLRCINIATFDSIDCTDYAILDGLQVNSGSYLAGETTMTGAVFIWGTAWAEDDFVAYRHLYAGNSDGAQIGNVYADTVFADSAFVGDLTGTASDWAGADTKVDTNKAYVYRDNIQFSRVFTANRTFAAFYPFSDTFMVTDVWISGLVNDTFDVYVYTTAADTLASAVIAGAYDYVDFVESAPANSLLVPADTLSIKINERNTGVFEMYFRLNGYYTNP